MKRYEFIAGGIRRQIHSGTLQTGDKLLSVRQVAREQCASIATVQRAYDQLVSESLCVSKPRSGYYVTEPEHSPKSPRARPRINTPQPTTERTEQLLIDWHRSNPEILDAFIPSADIFDTRRLDTSLRQAIRYSRPVSSARGLKSSEPALATAISRRAAKNGVYADPQTIIVTRSATAALNICISVLSRPGDVVLVESPAYFHSLASLRRRGLLVLEMQATSNAEMDPELFERLVQKHSVKLCLLSAANRYPTGSSLSSDTARKLVDAAKRNDTVIVESNVYGELAFDGTHMSLKQFDDSGIVIQFGSFTQLISSDYGLGYLMAEQFADEMLMVQYAAGMQGQDRWMQQAVAGHISSNQFERDLTALRRTLKVRVSEGLDTIRKLLPSSFFIEAPVGGYTGWLVGPDFMTALDIFSAGHLSRRHFLPGPIFSLDHRYHNCIGVNFSYKLDAAARSSLGKLSQL